MNQLDLFADPWPTVAKAPPPPVVAAASAVLDEPPDPDDDERAEEQAIAEAEAEAERGFEGYADDDENDAGELVAQVERFEIDRRARAERDRADWAAEKAAIAAAEAASAPEVLTWGKRKGFGGKYFEIALLRDGDRWRVMTDHSMPNMGGGGPFGPAKFASRDEALIATLRAELQGIARHLAGWNGSVFYGTEADWLGKARWCIDQAPSALFGGPELAAEFEQLRATYAARERLRCAAIRANRQNYIGEDGRERSIYSLGTVDLAPATSTNAPGPDCPF